MNNNEMIVESLIEYVKDSKTTYAVLLTAPWGVGKTYFAKHTLYKELERVAGKNIYYVSLNGIRDISQIAKSIFCNLELLKGVASTAINAFQSTFFSFNPLLSNIPFGDIKNFINDFHGKISDCVLIFDDYERCECKQAELLGYINQLCEHSSCKVIIIANEEEIKENDDYKRLREKVIGFSLEFEGNYYSALNSINDLYLKDKKELHKLMDSNKDKILSVANEYKHYNLRTYIFFLSVIKRIYDICSNDNLIKNLVGNVFEESVKFKSIPQLNSDLDNDVDIFYISSLQVNQLIFNLVHHGIVDTNGAKQVLENYANDISKNYLEDDDPVNVLVHWDEHSNQDITDAMFKIQDKLKSNKYGSDACAKTILYACHLQEKGFDEEKCRLLCDSVCDCLETNDILVNDEIDLPRFNVINGTSSFYKYYVERIKQINNNRKSNKLRKKLEEIIESADWGVRLENYILESKHIEDNNMFHYIDMECLLSKIKECNQIQIKHFIMALESRYSSSNFYEFYYSDLEFLDKLLQEVNSPPNSDQIAVKFQLNKLKEKLDYYVMKIKQYNERSLDKG